MLTQAFIDNQSVNYLVKQDTKRLERIKILMEYSFETSMDFGEVYLSEDKKACALLILPEKKETTFKSIGRDLALAFYSIASWQGIGKVLAKEAQLQKWHPKDKFFYHLWFLGVDPTYQQKGAGSQLLQEILQQSKEQKRPIYLETSTPKNIPWYKKRGFEEYGQLDYGFPLSLLRSV